MFYGKCFNLVQLFIGKIQTGCDQDLKVSFWDKPKKSLAFTFSLFEPLLKNCALKRAAKETCTLYDVIQAGCKHRAECAGFSDIYRAFGQLIGRERSARAQGGK